MDLRRAVGRVLVALAVIAAALAGVSTAPFDDGGQIQSFAVEDLVLNDDLEGDVPDEAGSGTCAGGAPPNHYAVWFRATVDDDRSGRFVDEETYTIEIRIGDHGDARTVSVLDGTSTDLEDVLFVRDDESASPGEEVTVTASLVQDGETFETVTRTALVRPGDPNCVTDG